MNRVTKILILMPILAKMRQARLSQCLNDCGEDSACRSACNRDYSDSINNCPCEENCPFGCPCSEYDCPSWENASSLLVLHWYDRLGKEILNKF